MDKRDEQTFAVIGAAMAVHRELGNGFLEPVYQEALAVEMEACDIPHQREVFLPIAYKGKPLTTTYRADFICFESLLVELKALDQLSNTERAQVLNYLKVTGIHRALLLNFGAQSLQFERIVL